MATQWKSRPQLSENSDPNHAVLSTTPKRPTVKPSPSKRSAKSTTKKKNMPATPRTPMPPRAPAVESTNVVGESEGSSKVRKMKSMMLEEAMSSIPEPGGGRVMHLVKAFERLLSFGKEEEGGISKGRVVNWALPGLRHAPRAAETGEWGSPEREGGFGEQSSVDSNGDRLSWGSTISDGDQRSRSKSTASSGRNWDKKLKATSQQPFKLRTEQRGKLKEEYFLDRVKQMLLEEQKQRIPIAQGLPWTTDNPECLASPCLKESTEPVDLVLHSDVRAVERAEFDFHVAERLTFIEQIKLERERLQKLEEEEEIRRLRRELVPKAQPMPYFDRPFVPKKSPNSRTTSKEPNLHTRPKKTSVRKLSKRGHS